MNKRWHFRREKRLISDRLGIGDLGKTLSSVLGLNVSDEEGPLSSSSWTRNHRRGASTSLVPVRILIDRKRY